MSTIILKNLGSTPAAATEEPRENYLNVGPRRGCPGC